MVKRNLKQFHPHNFNVHSKTSTSSKKPMTRSNFHCLSNLRLILIISKPTKERLIHIRFFDWKIQSVIKQPINMVHANIINMFNMTRDTESQCQDLQH